MAISEFGPRRSRDSPRQVARAFNCPYVSRPPGESTAAPRVAGPAPPVRETGVNCQVAARVVPFRQQPESLRSAQQRHALHGLPHVPGHAHHERAMVSEHAGNGMRFDLVRIICNAHADPVARNHRHGERIVGALERHHRFRRLRDSLPPGSSSAVNEGASGSSRRPAEIRTRASRASLHFVLTVACVRTRAPRR
jgi:hypothetical protein